MAQGYNARMDESLGMRRGRESKMKQNLRDRRDESYGMSKMRGNFGHASPVHKCDAFKPNRIIGDKAENLPTGNRGYPQQAWNYEY